MNTKLNMKELLVEGLYLCMKDKPFEKITIKQICDKTGVIRGTFYNHFIDKYEALEYLIYTMFIDDIDSYNTEDDFNRLSRHIIETIYQEQRFFTKCFLIEGQNGFETILMNIFNKIFDKILYSNDLVDKEFICSYYSHIIIFIIKDWNRHHYEKSAEEILKICYLLFYSNINTFTNK